MSQSEWPDPYFREVADWVHRKTGEPLESLRPSTRFLDVVDDSLDMVEFIMEVEDTFGIDVPERLFETTVITLQDLADFLRKCREG
jgi:acyl carrier protein